MCPRAATIVSRSQRNLCGHRGRESSQIKAMPIINTPNDPEFKWSKWSEWAWDGTRGCWRCYRYNFTNSEYEYIYQNGGSGYSSSVPRTVPSAQNVQQMSNSSQRLKQQSYPFSMQSGDEIPIASEYSPREDRTIRSTHSRNNISNFTEFPTSYTEPINYTTNGSAKSSFEPDYINVYGSMPQRSESAPPPTILVR
ncbi:hypothetical protein B0J14DRAFT_144685 [Halenospora varia]|nr:hypothetical protein B0J14DRAFT_144685 [Halenospora varia]